MMDGTGRASIGQRVFQRQPAPGVRVKKTRQIKGECLRSDAIGAEEVYSQTHTSARLAAQAAKSPTDSPKCRRSQEDWRIVLMGKSIGRF